MFKTLNHIRRPQYFVKRLSITVDHANPAWSGTFSSDPDLVRTIFCLVRIFSSDLDLVRTFFDRTGFGRNLLQHHPIWIWSEPFTTDSDLFLTDLEVVQPFFSYQDLVRNIFHQIQIWSGLQYFRPIQI